MIYRTQRRISHTLRSNNCNHPYVTNPPPLHVDARLLLRQRILLAVSLCCRLFITNSVVDLLAVTTEAFVLPPPPPPASSSSPSSLFSPKITQSTVTTTTASSSSPWLLWDSLSPNDDDDDDDVKTILMKDVANKATVIEPTFPVVGENPLVAIFDPKRINVVPATAWIVLMILAFTDNPIVPHSDGISTSIDAELLQQIVQNPLHPANVNELFYTLFNVFAPLPIILSALILPQEEMRRNHDNKNDNIRKSNVPFVTGDDTDTQISIVPAPHFFLVGSAALGYFVMGLYLSIRPKLPPSIIHQPVPVVPLISPTMVPWTWYTQNIWENKLLHGCTVLFLFYLPWGSNCVSAITEYGWSYVCNDFLQLLSSSRLVTISCIDLTLLHATLVSLIPVDYMLRTTHKMTHSPTTADTETGNDHHQFTKFEQLQYRANTIALLTALVPFIGPAVYVALRPSLVAKIMLSQEVET
jgi:hypothetical protein